MNITRKGIFAGVIVLFAVLYIATSVFGAEGPKWTGAFFIKGKIGLKWQALDGATEYKIMRKVGNGEFAELTVATKTQYFDTEISGGETYIYKIVCNAGGSEVESLEKTVVVPGAKAGEFTPPVWSGVRVEKGKIFLRWGPVPGAIAYNVYRSETAGTGYEVVGNTTAIRHVDESGVQRGGTYYYVVTALNEEFDETEYSEERSIKNGMNADEIREAELAETQVPLVIINLTPLFELTSANGEDMNQPGDVFVNSKGNIYVADVLKTRVNCYDSEGKELFSFGEKSSNREGETPPEGSFTAPFTLFIDKDDRVFVSDIQNNDIQIFTADGKFIKRIMIAAEDGMMGFRPNGLHVLPDGTIIASDAGNHRVLWLNEDGKILKSIGSNGKGDGEFAYPGELTVTADNTLCVVDIINCRIQEFDLDGNFIREFGEPGQSAGTFGRPSGITMDEKGQIWVSDALGHFLQVFTIDGEIKSALGTEEDEWNFSSPRGMFIKDGRLYTVTRLSNKVMVFKIG